jgi:GWxTD domain-containing protein
MPFFGNVIDTNDVFIVRYNRPEYKKLFIKFYKGDRPMPPPAFMVGLGGFTTPKPDSIWIYPRIDSAIFKLRYKGMYQFQVDTSTTEGLTLLNLGGDYPRVNRISQLVGPLAYLTTSDEMNEIQSSVNKKIAVDNFWLKVVGNTETARELIRIYYNRVYLANYYFTSEREGWKSDRGMIYIIYGLPTTIEKTATREIWKYYNKQRTGPINFVFRKQEIPFTNNYYVLDRNESININWREAVESWRSGKVYLMDE